MFSWRQWRKVTETSCLLTVAMTSWSRLGQEKSHDTEATGAQRHTESAIRTELPNCRCASLSSPSKCTVEFVIEVVVQ